MKCLSIILISAAFFSGLFNCNFFTFLNKDLDKEIEKLNYFYKCYENEEYDSENYDSTLFAFEKQIKNILKNYNFTNKELFESFNQNQFFTIKSNDDKLILISWEILDSGCHHSYKSLYRYRGENKNYVDYFIGIEKESFSEKNGPYPYSLFKLKENEYLVFNVQSVCMSSRLLSSNIIYFKNEFQGICTNCFNHNDGLYTSVWRKDTITFKFNAKTKELFYPELEPLIHEEENTGHTKTTGNYKKLIYKNGNFIYP